MRASEFWRSYYKAPEMLDDGPTDTEAGDIWSLGCIFYELIVGRCAFQNGWEVRELLSMKKSYPGRPDLGKVDRRSHILLLGMFEIEGSKRPSVNEIFDRLMVGG